jgi:CubicO group peptidase (beta-lactamase class C family)
MGTIGRLLAACGLLAAAAAAVAAAPVPLSPAERDLYERRVALVAGGRAADPTGIAVYDPLEAVPGASPYAPLPARPERERTIAPAALAAARDYAARNDSGALLVWRAGAVELAAYFGGSDAATPAVSRSLAKPIAAIAVGRAIALGAIRSLDQPVADFIPEWRGTDKAKILVRHLLDMRSGFLAQGPTFDPASIWARAYLGPRHEDVLVHEYPLTHTPGTRYEYSNQPSDLVAVLVERATGRRYAEFLSTEVFQPVGAPGGRVWVNRPGGVAHAGCCLLAPPELWLRLGILLAQDGRWEGRRLLPEGFVREMTTGTPENPYAGLGVYVAGRYVERRGAAHPDVPAPKTLHSEPYLARDLFLFDGNANQVVYVVPSLDLVILRTGDEPPREPGWDNAFLPNTIIRGLRLAPGESPPDPQPR